MLHGMMPVGLVIDAQCASGALDAQSSVSAHIALLVPETKSSAYSADMARVLRWLASDQMRVIPVFCHGVFSFCQGALCSG